MARDRIELTSGIVTVEEELDLRRALASARLAAITGLIVRVGGSGSDIVVVERGVVISNQDPCFTSHFSMALTKKLGIQQNLSSAFHLQTDRLLERKNQWVEQYLRLVTAMQPEDWEQWLPLVSTVHNNQRNATTGLLPNQILLGYETELMLASSPLMNNKQAKD